MEPLNTGLPVDEIRAIECFDIPDSTQEIESAALIDSNDNENKTDTNVQENEYINATGTRVPKQVATVDQQHNGIDMNSSLSFSFQSPIFDINTYISPVCDDDLDGDAQHQVLEKCTMEDCSHQELGGKFALALHYRKVHPKVYKTVYPNPKGSAFTISFTFFIFKTNCMFVHISSFYWFMFSFT